MIQSLFILSSTGEVLIERHFRGVVTSRNVCTYFWERASESIANHHGGITAVTRLHSSMSSSHTSNTSDSMPQTTSVAKALYDSVPPVMEVPESDQGTLYVISILRDGLSYLAVCPAEVSPLLILSFLQRICDIFVEYFGSPADESAIKDNFSTVYQLLEEMIDNGWPLTTEPNALKAMIRPPNILSKLLGGSDAVSRALPSGTVSNMPWRAAGVYYSQNELYLDIVEEVDAIVTASGNVVSSDVTGRIVCQSHLSGIPDLLLTFKDPTIIDDWSFHPCVRYARYEQDQIVSFVPPDGDFELMKYRIRPDHLTHGGGGSSAIVQPPVYCHVQYFYNGPSKRKQKQRPEQSQSQQSSGSLPLRSGRIMLNAGVTSLSSLVVSASRKGPLQVEDVAITIPFPQNTRTTSNFSVNMGTILYDEAAKVLQWTLGTMDSSKKASLSCSFTTAPLYQSQRRRKGGGGTLGATSFGGMVSSSATPYSYKSALYDYDFEDDAYNRSDDEDDDEDDDAESPPNLSLTWKIPLASVSGLSVSGLSVTGENYRPYKGVRNITKSGLFQIRCTS